jgi:hypothetical protein
MLTGPQQLFLSSSSTLASSVALLPQIYLESLFCLISPGYMPAVSSGYIFRTPAYSKETRQSYGTHKNERFNLDRHMNISKG